MPLKSYEDFKEVHSRTHDIEDGPYKDRLFVAELLSSFSKNIIGVELCWASLVLFSHEDRITKDIEPCKNCGYCKPTVNSDKLRRK